MNPMLTPEQVALILNVRIRQVYLFIRRKQIKAAKIGRQLRISQEELAQFLKNQAAV